MAAKDRESYDWLNDPFDEKKAAAEREAARMSAGPKVALGCGCLLTLIVVVGVSLFVFASLASVMGS